ncbi:MAG: chromate efflux transporter [Pirellulales bacterium]
MSEQTDDLESDQQARTSEAALGDSNTSSLTQAVTWGEALIVWSRVACLSFGGPTGQIAVMHRIIVEEKKWVSEERFLHALNFCMLLPGPEAQQLATYLGFLAHRTWGGIVAGVLFILPGMLAILGLSVLYVEFQEVKWIEGLFLGLKPAVIAVVLEAVLRLGKRVLQSRALEVIAALSFIAIFFFQLPFPLIILAAACAGYLGGRLRPEWFATRKPPTRAVGGASDRGNLTKEQLDPPSVERIAAHPLPAPTISRAIRVTVVCLTLWFTPLIAVAFWQGRQSMYVAEGLYFSKAAMVTFGGAYSVLSYVAQEAVERRGWLTATEMLDGLGLAESTPGPLIMVVQFVAFLAAYRNPGSLSPLTGAVLGSMITTWVTFTPCFYWIFLGAPYIDRLRSNQRLTAAMSAITGAVLGVVANLGLWFALHTLFGQVEQRSYGLVRWLAPDLAAWRPLETGIAAVAMLLLFATRRGLGQTLLACAALGVAAKWWFSH